MHERTKACRTRMQPLIPTIKQSLIAHEQPHVSVAINTLDSSLLLYALTRVP